MKNLTTQLTILATSILLLPGCATQHLNTIKKFAKTIRLLS